MSIASFSASIVGSSKSMCYRYGMAPDESFAPVTWRRAVIASHNPRAAAKIASCRYLITEDLKAGQTLDGIEVVNPFLHGLESIL
jgi:predicted nucleic acid-binding protein